MMRYQEFVTHVQHQARLNSEEEAETAVAATLHTLGERLPASSVHDLAAHLTIPLADALRHSLHRTETFTAHHFFRRISERTTGDITQAIHQARAVIAVLHEAVPAETMQHVCNQLSADFNPLFTQRQERRPS